jgi:hypothetical protein
MPLNDLGDVTDKLVGVFADPGILIGIPLALLGAVFMSFGAQYQHRVQKVERLTSTAGGTGLTGGQIWNLLRRPSWVAGTVMLGLAIVCQLTALSFAPSSWCSLSARSRWSSRRCSTPASAASSRRGAH